MTTGKNTGNKMTPKIALFPACGSLASCILAQLLRQVPASELLLVARKPEKLSHLSREGATVRYADYDVPASLGQVFEGADVLMLVSYASIEIEYRANVSDPSCSGCESEPPTVLTR